MALKQQYWEDVQVGQELPSYSLKLNATRMVLQVSGTQDYYPVHHDKEFAEEAGHPDIFVNTRFSLACLSRLITDWMGDEGWLRKLNMQMRRMNRPGDTMTMKGKVTSKYVSNSDHCVELDVWIENEREGVTTPATAMVILPPRGS